MLWFTGDRVVSAYAQTVDVRGLKHPDIGQTMYRFAGGATATLETVWCMPEKTPFDIDERMSIIGTEGFIHVQDTFPNLGIVSTDRFHSPDTTYWPMFDGVRGGALREEFAYFAELRADRHASRRSDARGRDGGARGDARRRGIGAHRRGRAAGSLDPVSRRPRLKRTPPASARGRGDSCPATGAAARRPRSPRARRRRHSGGR